jgi:hypothetical protein
MHEETIGEIPQRVFGWTDPSQLMYSPGVVAAVAQCEKGIVLSWAPYFLNIFLEDCRDA